MLQRIHRMLVKEFLQVLRDPKTRAVIFVVPIVQTLVFGYAVTTDVRDVPLAILDFDESFESRELVSRFGATDSFRIEVHTGDAAEARRLLDLGQARALLRIDRGFGAGLRRGRTEAAQLIVDGTDSNTAGIVVDYGSRIATRFAREVLEKRLGRLQGATGHAPSIDLETRTWFNENLESRNFYVPGVIAILVLLITLLLTSMAVVREKEIGTMEQIIVTPIRPLEFILGKTVPFALIGFADVLLITTLGVFWFDVPIRGSLLLLLVATGLYLMTTLGLGLWISTVSETQQQAMMSAFFVYFPAVLLSGFMFPIANMPFAIQILTYVNPLRYFLVIVRGIFLKGVGTAVLWPQMAALAVMGVVILWLASRRFRKTLA